MYEPGTKEAAIYEKAYIEYIIDKTCPDETPKEFLHYLIRAKKTLGWENSLYDKVNLNQIYHDFLKNRKYNV